MNKKIDHLGSRMSAGFLGRQLNLMRGFGSRLQAAKELVLKYVMQSGNILHLAILQPL